MPRTRLDQYQVDQLQPRRAVYQLRDTERRGFGVQIQPSGRKRYFLQVQHRGRRIWRTLGDASVLSLDEARTGADAVATSLREHAGPVAAPPERTKFEAVADEVFRRYGRRWKPRTRRVNAHYLGKHILPRFGGRQIADITRRDVRLWQASMRRTPVSADRSVPVLSVIMRQAEIYGYRPEHSNPCKGIRRYRRRGRERFLTPGEYASLGNALARHESRDPSMAAALRLLVLTGCRKSEILELEWSSYREGNLYLPDSKTGPRTVWLSGPARRVLDALPRKGRWVFQAKRSRGHLTKIDRLWFVVRAEAGLTDVRLHDLRHSYASVAMLRGEPLPVIGALLGHADPGTTLKYLHLSDATAQEAVQTMAAVLNGQG